MSKDKTDGLPQTTGDAQRGTDEELREQNKLLKIMLGIAFAGDIAILILLNVH
jgi:hypothetical protein